MGKCLSGKMAEQVPKSMLFVCLGNICRSLIAEAVFRKLVTDSNVSNKWAIDSALREHGPVTSSMSCELPKKSWHWHSPQARQVIIEDLPHLITYYVWMKATWEIWLGKVIKLRTTKLKLNYLGAVIPRDSLLLKNLLWEWDQSCEVLQGLPGQGGLAVSISCGPAGTWLCVPDNCHVHSARPVLVLPFTYCFLP